MDENIVDETIENETNIDENIVDETIVEKKKKKPMNPVLKEWGKFFLTTAIIVGVLFCIFTYVPYFSSRTNFVIVSGSMDPVIKIGDVAIIDTTYNLEDLEVGDIIAFYANLDMVGGDEVVVHYIADIHIEQDGSYTFHTMRGNDNPQKIWDNWEITETDIIGAFDFRIMYIGKLMLFSESIFGKGILIADIIIIYLIFDIAGDNKKQKKILSLKQQKRILSKAEKHINNKNGIDPVKFSKSIDKAVNLLYVNNMEELIHSKRVSKICELIATEMGLPLEEIENVRIAGLLHDIGKIDIDEKILNKPSYLEPDEREIIQKHSEFGCNLLSSVETFSKIGKIILEHHERWDGNGYPNKIKGDDISLQARIVAVADAYDAMISDRPYKKACNREEVIQEIERCAGSQFDPNVVNVSISQVFNKFLTEAPLQNSENQSPMQ